MASKSAPSESVITWANEYIAKHRRLTDVVLEAVDHLLVTSKKGASENHVFSYVDTWINGFLSNSSNDETLFDNVRVDDALFALVVTKVLSWHGPENDLSTPLRYRRVAAPVVAAQETL